MERWFSGSKDCWTSQKNLKKQLPRIRVKRKKAQAAVDAFVIPAHPMGPRWEVKTPGESPGAHGPAR